MKETKEKAELREIISEARSEGKTIGFVPTMGYLHEGHMSLVERSVNDSDFTIVSIFVNPAQFAPDEDLAKYPRDYTRDLALLLNAGIDCIYYPEKESLYHENFSTWVYEEKISKNLCGVTRPDHFKGVLTIVAKLFNIVQPDFAYFGQKDFQQATLITKMVKELDFPLQIIVCPTIREDDGLAMSSRNSYLNKKQRKDALVFSKTLFEIGRAFDDGERDVKILLEIGKAFFGKKKGAAELEYLEIRKVTNLDHLDLILGAAVVLIAGKSGKTRLIDNVILGKAGTDCDKEEGSDQYND